MSDDKMPEATETAAENAPSAPEAESASVMPAEAAAPENMPVMTAEADGGISLTSMAPPEWPDIPPLDHTDDPLPSHDPHWNAIKKWMRRELSLIMRGVESEDDRREMNP